MILILKEYKKKFRARFNVSIGNFNVNNLKQFFK